ncbi:hypothetical protein D3C81_2292400 [compost metagenome]
MTGFLIPEGMYEYVLNDGLYKQPDDPAVVQLLRDINFRRQHLLVPGLLYAQVMIDLLQLIAQCC